MFNYCEANGIEFAIGGRWCDSLKAAVRDIPQAQWKKYTDCAVAEVCHTMNNTNRAFRMVVVRRQTQIDLFDEQGEQDSTLHTKYTLVASNLFVLFKAVTLDQTWQRRQVQTVRWRLLHQAGKVVRTAGAWVLKVSTALLQMMDDIRTRTRQFAYATS